MPTRDPFEGHTPGLESPVDDGFDITPSDAADLEFRPRWIYVGGGGNLRVQWKSGRVTTYFNVPPGGCLPIRPIRVLSTGTSAQNIIGHI